MYDYIPFQIRRAFASKDFKYIANFDYKGQRESLWDPATGKSM